MKSRLDAIWKALGIIKDGVSELSKQIADFEGELAQQTEAVKTLDTKIDRLQKTEVALEQKSKELDEASAKLESVKANLAKLKASI